VRRFALFLLFLGACDGDAGGRGGAGVAVPGRPGALKSAALVRADRRAFDGAPPVIPHQNFGMSCVQCHKTEGVDLPGVGFAPPMPHDSTPGLSAISRCTQCHVFRLTPDTFRPSEFAGLRQDLRKGRRQNPFAPPVMPHAVQMRENCLACHSGPAAREEIRCPHPERPRCSQCHVPSTTPSDFAR
jgi:cytochrome c-type protein NapB